MKEQIENQAIEEMANDVARSISWCNEEIPCVDCLGTAASLYAKDYRKQREGEWETIPNYQPEKLTAYRHICSVCKTFYKDISPYGHKYCHECGAMMKGGEQK